MIAENQRLAAAAMPEMELRKRVDRLIEQAAKEERGPVVSERHGMLYASEIFYLLGVGPLPGAAALADLSRMIDEDERKGTEGS
jgi:hypothetical protein